MALISPPPPTPDPQWFYSSVAQVSSAFVGFLGGFFILRLQTYSQEWRELRLEIERLSRVIAVTQAASRRLRREVGNRSPAAAAADASTPTDEPSADEVQMQRRRTDALRELPTLLDRRASATFPFELTLMAILLFLLLLGGVGAPLLALPRPGIHEKLVYLLGVGGLFLALGTSMLVLALISFRRLKKDLPSGG